MALQLGTEEGFVLSRIDGTTDLDQLASVTGLPVPRLEAILERLVREGAVEAPAGARSAAPSPPPAELDPLVGLLDSPPDEQTPEHVESDSAAGSPRLLFETRLHPLPEDTRAGLAGTAVEPELSAFCFDPVPQVIARVLGNPRCGLAHARLISAHHRNAAGFEALAARSEFLRDGEVQRFLLRNPQTPAHLLRALLLKRRLADLYRAGHDREVSERTRGAAREVLRERFAKGSPEERAELIVVTEGRALACAIGPVSRRQDDGDPLRATTRLDAPHREPGALAGHAPDLDRPAAESADGAEVPPAPYPAAAPPQRSPLALRGSATWGHRACSRASREPGPAASPTPSPCRPRT